MNTPTPARGKARQTPLLLTALSGPAVLFTLIWLWFWKKPLGVKGEWAIDPHPSAWPLGAWGLPIAALFIFGGFAALSAYDRFKRAKNRREQIASTRLSLLGITLLAVVWPWASLGPTGTSNLINSQWSDISNEYFGTAYEIEDARTFTQSYAATRQHPDSPLQAHVATHPPGAVLAYYFARRIYEASPFLQNACSSIAASLTHETVAELAVRSNELRRTAARSAGVRSTPRDLPPDAVGGAVWCAFLISLLLALATPGVYLIATSTPRDENATSEGVAVDAAETRGLIAAALWALAPAVNLFAFTLDAVIAFGAAWTLAFLAVGLRGGNRLWFFAAGLLLAATSYVSFGALSIGVIAIIALLFFRQRQIGAVIKDILVLACGFIFVWLMIVVLLPMHPLVVFSQAMEAHRMATVNSRSRFAWTALNLLSFAIFCGWPLVLSTLLSAWQRWQHKNLEVQSREDEALLHGNLRIAAAIGLAGLAVVLLLNFSGQALGEVERLWMFLLPSLCVLASLAVARWNALMIAALLALQAAQTLMMAGWLSPLVLPL